MTIDIAQFDDIKDLILSNSAKYNVDKYLIAAVIWQESRANCMAVRYEPDFLTHYGIPSLTKEKLPRCADGMTEAVLRSTSWGTMQIMGLVAREHGFTGEWLTQLIDPEISIDLGVKFLARLLEKHGDESSALLAWNGGGNSGYPSSVEQWKQQLIETRFLESSNSPV